MTRTQHMCLLTGFLFFGASAFSQDNSSDSNYKAPATIIVFRTVDLFNFKFSYNLFSGDSLLGRIKTHDVIILETLDLGITLHATTQAPSLNAGKRANHRKIKNIKVPFALKLGQVYFIKCGFLNQSLFDYPRQPTIQLINEDEVRKYIRKRFLRKKIQAYLYGKWLAEKNVSQ